MDSSRDSESGGGEDGPDEFVVSNRRLLVHRTCCVVPHFGSTPIQSTSTQPFLLLLHIGTLSHNHRPFYGIAICPTPPRSCLSSGFHALDDIHRGVPFLLLLLWIWQSILQRSPKKHVLPGESFLLREEIWGQSREGIVPPSLQAANPTHRMPATFASP